MAITALQHPASSLLAILAICLVTAAPASAQSPKTETKTEKKTEKKTETKTETKIDTSKYIIFIHAGPNKKDDKEVRLISGVLFGKGYVVRAPDEDQDEVGGTGVDYFDESAKDAAQDVATTVNETFTKLRTARDSTQILSPRRVTKTKNPPFWLAVWLF